MLINGNLVMSSGSTYAIAFSGSAPVIGYSQATVTGTITLNNATLTVNTTGFSPTSLQRYYIVINDGGAAITGTFNGMPNGSLVNVGGFVADISYFGDSAIGSLNGGHDVVLYNFASVPEPKGVLGIIAFAALAVGLYRHFLRGAALAFLFFN